MDERANSSVAFSHMAAIAAFSFLTLIAATFWQIQHGLGSGDEITARNTESATTAQAKTPFETINWQAPIFAENSTVDPDGLSHIGENVVGALVGSYATLAQTGSYTPESGEQVAADIAQSLRATVSYPTYTADNLKKDADTSHARMMRYRADMRVALEPLLKNNQYELSLFAFYVETQDKKYTTALENSAANYRKAVESAASVVVPSDAALEHVGILNALSEYGAILEKMALHGEDAFAAVALLRTYDEAEKRMFDSFDALAKYGKNKQS